MQELLITNIQRMSFHDGPGMRTTVFLKGCNLRCAWCHNPETQNPQPELIFRAQRCVRCGTCVHSCASGARTMGPEGPVRDTARCVGCGRCAQACLTGAIDVAGRRISCQELTELVLRDEKIFRTTAGGVTYSGRQTPWRSFWAGCMRAACIHASTRREMSRGKPSSRCCR